MVKGAVNRDWLPNARDGVLYCQAVAMDEIGTVKLVVWTLLPVVVLNWNVACVSTRATDRLDADDHRSVLRNANCSREMAIARDGTIRDRLSVGNVPHKVRQRSIFRTADTRSRIPILFVKITLETVKDGNTGL